MRFTLGLYPPLAGTRTRRCLFDRNFTRTAVGAAEPAFASPRGSQGGLVGMGLDDMPETLTGGGQIAAGGLQAGVAEQLLELYHVGARFQSRRGERVAQGVHQRPRRHLCPDSGPHVQTINRGTAPDRRSNVGRGHRRTAASTGGRDRARGIARCAGPGIPTATSSSRASMGIGLVFPPLPRTSRRRAPGSPHSEPMSRLTASASRIPVTQNVATSGQIPGGPRLPGPGVGLGGGPKQAADGIASPDGPGQNDRRLGFRDGRHRVAVADALGDQKVEQAGPGRMGPPHRRSGMVGSPGGEGGPQRRSVQVGQAHVARSPRSSRIASRAPMPSTSRR